MSNDNNFKFDPVQLMLKVNDHSNKLKHLEELLKDHFTEDNRKFREVQVLMENLSKATAGLNDTLKEFKNKYEGGKWVALRFWTALTLVGGTAYALGQQNAPAAKVVAGIIGGG